MFSDFMAATKIIYLGDFSHVIDMENQWIASQFVARNDYDDGRHVEMRNCNFFQIEDDRFKRVTIYMTDEKSVGLIALRARFPQAPGARSASLATRHSARRAVARSGPGGPALLMSHLVGDPSLRR